MNIELNKTEINDLIQALNHALSWEEDYGFTYSETPKRYNKLRKRLSKYE